MGTEVQVVNLVNEILKVESLEEAFSCFLVQRPEQTSEKLSVFLKELENAFANGTPIEQESALKQYLLLAVAMSNPSRLHVLFSLLENLVSNKTLPAKLVCDCILTCDKLVYQNEFFWVESFKLVKKILPGVDYKHVREIMKICWEKAKTLPANLNAAVINQMKALESVLEFIFDRNNCLLPAYLVADEILKDYSDYEWPHWKLSKVFSDFIESMRPIAQMISIINHSRMLPVIEQSGLGEHNVDPWKLDSVTLKLAFKRRLPYDACLLEPQTHLLRFIIAQPYSRDMICSMLGLQKQNKKRCEAIELQLVELVMFAMERTEEELSAPGRSDDNNLIHLYWLPVSNQLLCFLLFQFVNFGSFLKPLHERLTVRHLRKGRDYLMWTMLQFISGSITRNPLSNFLPVLNLYDLLYPEREPLPVPDVTKPHSMYQMSALCVWIHLIHKAQLEHQKVLRQLPTALKLHNEFLQLLLSQTTNMTMTDGDYRIALLCNAYSTWQEFFSRPVAMVFECLQGSSKGPGGTCGMTIPTTPLSMSMLDFLTVHAKMSLIHSITNHIMKAAQSKSNIALAPALVETYSRLLVYTEIESIGIKGFISSLLPCVFKSHAWVILYTLLEMFSYRMHHTQPQYRIQLLTHLHNIAAVPQTNQTQLHLCLESTALRLITGLGSREVQPQLTRVVSEPKCIVSTESEELNRALVLTLARSLHITGIGGDSSSSSWCKEILNAIMHTTPHNWAHNTIKFFPPLLADFFHQYSDSVPKENKQQLKKAVEEEYRNWASMNNENDIIAHFSVPHAPPLFLCILCKMILETDRISPIAYKILERIGARALSSHLRKFCDYVVFEIASSPESSAVHKSVDAINDMIWKYNIVTIDRLVLCMVLRAMEGNEAQVCFIIQLLLLKTSELRSRISEFVKENSHLHWKQSNWHEKHLAFHRKYPEKCAPEEQSGGTMSSTYHSLPVYFGNVCLRFLPVFDIVIHRYIELADFPKVVKSLDSMLDNLGSLYKFHDRPVTYLYNTLHYYERMLRDRPLLKRKLVSAILGNLSASRGLSEQYQAYMAQPADKPWVPPLEYYIDLIQRIVNTMSGGVQHLATDWRFNEFPNPPTHALYMTCVELMALPAPPGVVATNILDVITKGYSRIERSAMPSWINAVGLVLSSLPDSYRTTMDDQLVATITHLGTNPLPSRIDPISAFNFDRVHHAMLDNQYAYILAIAHSVWHHAGYGQIATVPLFLKERVTALVQTEEQMLFVCQLVGPFLSRLFTLCSHELSLEFYTMLEQVDKNVPNMRYMDAICDLLYHIKYNFVGDAIKSEAETIVRRLRPALQKILRFITHFSLEEIETQEILKQINTDVNNQNMIV